MSQNTYLAAGESGSVLSSTDGGLNWIKKPNSFTHGFDDLDFADPLNGFGVGKDLGVVKTSDGGNTRSLLIEKEYHLFQGVSCIDAMTAFVVEGYGVIRKTTDAGITWQVRDSTIYADKIDFFNTLHGIAIGRNSRILETTDGGMSWIKQEPVVSNHYYNLHNYDDKRCIVVGAMGAIFKRK